MDYSVTDNLPNREDDNFKVVSTPKSAFIDPFNWFMIIPLTVAVIFGLVEAITFSKWIWLLLVAFSIWFLYHYINAILHMRD
jgi:hypothetical protein